MNAVAEDIHRFLASQPRMGKRRLPDTFLGLDTLTRGGIANAVGTSVAAELDLDRKTFANLLNISPATLDRRNGAKADFKGAETDALYKLLAVAGRKAGAQDPGERALVDASRATWPRRSRSAGTGKDQCRRRRGAFAA